MMSILEKIVAQKRVFVNASKLKTPVSTLEKIPLFSHECLSFFDFLAVPGPSVIAEFKRKSPSKGNIHIDAVISEIIPAYSRSGVAAISVLTDDHFGGKIQDMEEAVKLADVPVLRKDFIIDEYQILEAKAFGASAILLIAAVLDKKEIHNFTLLARQLGMDVLLELHDENELTKISLNNNIIGINNRNLGNFKLDIHKAISLINHLDKGVIKVAESGIQDVAFAARQSKAGFDAFLIGEYFMKDKNPPAKAAKFINELKKILNNEN